MPAFRSYGGFPYTRACDGVGHTRVMVSGNSLSYARDGVTKFIPYAYDGVRKTHLPTRGMVSIITIGSPLLRQCLRFR